MDKQINLNNNWSMGVCALSKKKSPSFANGSENSTDKLVQIRIKASARDLIALQARSKSQGFKNLASTKISTSVSVRRNSFSPFSFEEINKKISAFDRMFVLTEEFIEIKGKGFALFGFPLFLQNYLSQREFSYLESPNDFSNWFLLSKATNESPLILKATWLDVFDENSFSHFAKAKAQSDFYTKIEETRRISKKDQIKEKQKLFLECLPKFVGSANLAYFPIEFWKKNLVHVQIFEMADFRLDQFLSTTLAAKISLHPSLVCQLILAVLKLSIIVCQNKDIADSNFDLQLTGLFIQKIGYFANEKALKFLYFEDFSGVEPEFSVSFKLLLKYGKDLLRTSLLVLSIFLLEAVDFQTNFTAQVRILRESIVKNCYFDIQIFYKILDMLEGTKDKIFLQISSILKFLSEEPNQIKDSRKFLEHFAKKKSISIEPIQLNEGPFLLGNLQSKPVDKSATWLNYFYQAEICFVLQHEILGLQYLKSSMSCYKDFCLDTPTDPNLCELFFLFSAFLFASKDFKSGLHYFKEASKLKTHQSDCESYSLMKIQLYILSLKYLRNSSDQHNILINIILGFIHKVKSEYASKLVRHFIRSQLTKEYSHKLVGPLSEESQVKKQIETEILQKKRGLSEQKINEGQKQNTKNEKRISIKEEAQRKSEKDLNYFGLKEICFSDLLTALSGNPNSKICESLPEEFLSKMTSEYYLNELMMSSAYCIFLNSLCFYYLSQNEFIKLKILLHKIFSCWRTNPQFLEWHANEKINLEIFVIFFINLILINDRFKFEILPSEILTVLLNKISEKDYLCFLLANRILLRNHLSTNQPFFAAEIIERLIAFLINNSEKLKENYNADELNSLLKLRERISALLPLKINETKTFVIKP